MTARQQLNYTLKLIVSHLLFYCGLLQLWQKIGMRRKAVVLMYHRVLTDDELQRTASHPALVVGRDSFESQMAVLKSRFKVLSLEEFATRIKERTPFSDSSCLITFDDGWRDNLTNALPILRRYGLPALIFLPVNYIGQHRMFWQEGLTHALLNVVMETRRDPAQLSRFNDFLSPFGLQSVLQLTARDPRPGVIAAVGRQKQLPRAKVQELVASLAAALGVQESDWTGPDGFITWQQAESMSKQDISFGSHGVEHLLLTQITNDEAEAEIRISKDVLDQKLRASVPTFSYPNGYLTDAHVNQVAAAGYQLAFITRRGLVSCTDPPFTIRRLNIHESATSTTPMFMARLVGLW